MPRGCRSVPPGHKNISEENHRRPRKAKDDRNMLLATFLSVGVKTLLASRDRLKPDAYVSLSAAGDTAKLARKVRLYRCTLFRDAVWLKNIVRKSDGALSLPSRSRRAHF